MRAGDVRGNQGQWCGVRGNQQIRKCLKNAYTSGRLLTENRLLDLAIFLVPDDL